MTSSPPSPAERYVAWLARRQLAIIAVTVVLVGVALYLIAFHLPLRADFSHLLPPDAPAVRDLHKLEERVTSKDTLLVVIEADDPAVREHLADEMATAARALPPDLVSMVEDDDADSRAFLKDHRWLFASLEDLEMARDALRTRVKIAKKLANPMFVDVDSDETKREDDAAKATLDGLRSEHSMNTHKLDRSSFVSADGKGQLVIVRTGFEKTDVDSGRRLIDALDDVRDRVLAEPAAIAANAQMGFTGGVATTVAEHEALVRGMVMSSLVTGLLVALVLAAYFRSIRLLALLTIALFAGTLIAFGAAAITVGHLNAATAFLGAIIAGNGVNYGILLIARYLEERKTSDVDGALAVAIQGTLRPTAVAALGASIAYGSLAATSFRGFADFAVIGGVGMLLCWVASYTLLPAMVLRWGSRTKVTTGAPFLGSVIARVLGFRRSGIVVLVTAALAAFAGYQVYRFIAEDPYEYDMTQLRSDGPDAQEARKWIHVSDDQFGRGISGQTLIAADDLDQVPQIVAALAAIDKGVPDAKQTIGAVHSILEVMPGQDVHGDAQDQKLAILADIRKQLDPQTLDLLSDDEREQAEELLPPPDLDKIMPDTLPEEIKAKLREKDGRIGLIIGVRPDIHLNEWNGKDLIRFANAIRRLHLPNGDTVTTSGTQVVYADILAAIDNDGPLVVAVAAALLILMVLIVVGRNIRAVAVLTAPALGSLFLIAVCALTGIKVTFLDFVALPITLGIGVDYSINVAHRHHHGEDLDPVETLRTSGAAVFICSLTTIIGYGSLLVSENMAIKGFGTASLIGEICCVLTALVVVPAIVSLRHPARDLDKVSTEVALGEEPPVAR